MAESLEADASAVRVPVSYWVDPLGTRRSRLVTFFLLYVSEGIPLGFTATVIATHMRREGLDPEVIGAYVGSLYLPWAFKWVLGPVVDTVTSVRFGRRRTWIVGAQLAMMLALLAAWPIDFVTSLTLFTAVIFVHNVCSAAQDVAIDALAVQVLPESERGTANGFMFAGQASGQALGGGGVLLLTETIAYGGTYLLVVAMLAAILVGVSWRLREAAPVASAIEATTTRWRRIVADVQEFVRTAARAFVSSRAALVGVPFAALPLGAYALSLSLQSNLAVELGLADAEIGRLGLWSSVLSALGCVVGGWLSDRFGRRRMLALFIALTAVPALFLGAAMQSAGHVMPADPASVATVARDVELVRTFWTATLCFTFVQGLTYGSSSALYMDITNPAVAATQFTAYMALGNLVTTYTSTWQGFTLSAYGYPITLALDAGVGLIAIALLPWLGVRRAQPSGRASAR
jgi:PAT family beta-lactamase induction signal transducer AmpG